MSVWAIEPEKGRLHVRLRVLRNAGLTRMIMPHISAFKDDITERERILVALEESNERFEQLTQHSRAIAWETNKDGVFTYVSGAVQTVLGYLLEEIESQGDVFDLIVPSKRSKMRSGFLYALKKGKSFSNIICPCVDRFGNTVLLSINGIPRFNKDNTLRSYRGLAIDITEKAKMQQQILVEEERYKTTLLSVGEGVISTDCNGRITVMNPLAETMTGWLQQDAVGKCLGLVLKVIEEQNGRICESPANIVLHTSRVFQPYFPTLLVSKSGEEIPVQIIAAPIKNNTGDISGVVIVFRNFSEYRERQKQIEFLSYHDHLTGLFNRRYLTEAYKKLNIPSNLPLTVMTLDVNGLKLTNDAFGHEMGDRLLIAVADTLRKAFRANEIIARVGGDEFTILLPRSGRG
jgi:PAS domain S-box-containing protein